MLLETGKTNPIGNGNCYDSPLYYACHNKNSEMAMLLITKYLNGKFYDYDAMKEACKNRMIEFLQTWSKQTPEVIKFIRDHFPALVDEKQNQLSC